MICLSLLKATIVMASAVCQAQTDSWQTVETQVGYTVSTPVDLGTAVTTASAGEKAWQEVYSPKSWSGCVLTLSRKAFDKDEDPTDSEAVKLEDVVYDEIDATEDPVSKITFQPQEGWPSVDMEGKQKDGTYYHFRVCRTKNRNYTVSLFGKTLPDKDVVKRLFESYKLPKDAEAGKLTKWGPVPKKTTLGDSKIEVWSPMELKATEMDAQSDDGVKAKRYGGEFGYSRYEVIYVELPLGSGSTITDEILDQIVRGRALQEADDEEEAKSIKFGPFKSVTTSGINFRTTTFLDIDQDGRIDVTVTNDVLYIFLASVPHGLAGSEDVKHFFSSIVFH